MFEPIDEARGTVEIKPQVPAEQDAQQRVESGEMIHVGVADEDVAEAQQLARAQIRNIAEIEQHGAFLEHELAVDAGIAERVVDKLPLHDRPHGT